MPAARMMLVAQSQMIPSMSRAFDFNAATASVASAKGIVTSTAMKPAQIVRSMGA